ncbi:hypothetical protein A4A49_40556 [Nicotiana attenuata]|uniref:Uncharacterized protein n=1 Tax=Nicotiana attenuata TaxID=49451 RepID=A0A314KW74_NICAT|nr:hypothetical protein A4A49_40556 [Nicotiana attenuata]
MLHSYFPKVIVEAQADAPINDEEATDSDTQWFAKSTQQDTAEQLSHFAAMILDPFASLVPCDKFPIGLTLVVPVNVNLDYGHMLDTCYYCHTKAYASLYYAYEATIGTIPFYYCVDNWFDTWQYFRVASYVILTVESADLKQIEGFTPFITQTELGGECGESAEFFSCLVDQLSVSLVPADFWDVATHESVNNGVELSVCQVLGGTQISVVPHEHRERDMPTREGGRHSGVCSALCKVLLEDENGSSTGEFNDQCILGQFPFNPIAKFLRVTIYATAPALSVWDPGISFAFWALTDSIEYVTVLPLLECISRLCFITYSNYKTRVWDPGQLWFVKSYNLQSPFALSVTTLPSLAHFYIANWICVTSQPPLAIAFPGSYSYADTNQNFLLCSPKIFFLPLVTNSSGELILAKDDIELLRNINCKSTRAAILGDLLELDPTEYMYNELMLQLCCDARLNVVALVGTRFFTAAENINCADEIKLVCTNDAHCMASEIINHLINNDGIYVQGSSQRQLGVTLAFVNFIFPTELCRAVRAPQKRHRICGR